MLATFAVRTNFSFAGVSKLARSTATPSPSRTRRIYIFLHTTSPRGVNPDPLHPSVTPPIPRARPSPHSAMQRASGIKLSVPLFGKKKPLQLLGLKIFDANGTCRKCQGTEAQHQPFVCSRPRRRGGGRTTVCQGWCMYRNREGGQKSICSVCPNCRKPALDGPQVVVEE